MNIGKELKRIRLSQEMTLEELSNKCGYSKALISRVETGWVSPSITSLTKMVSALGLKIHDLFVAIEQGQASIVRREERRRFHTDAGVTTEFLATSITTKKMEPVKVTIPPRHTSGSEAAVQHGEQFMFVLNGNVEVTAGEQNHKLGTGDSIYIGAGAFQRWRNVGKGTAEVISVLTPPQI